MSELATTEVIVPHPREGMCKELFGFFVRHNIGAYCRFAHDGGGFILELTTLEKLFSWNLTHGGYFRRFSKDLSTWRNVDYDNFCRQLKSPEFYAEICTDNIRIYKHRDFSV